MDNTALTIFVAVTAVAFVLQLGVIVAMFLALRKTSAKLESLAEEVKTKVLPTAELAQQMITDLRPKISTVLDNVVVSTTVLRNQMERMDATLTDIIDRTRLQVIRADEFVNHTMDKLEETREAVSRTVVSPVKHISGLMHGVTAGLEAFFARKRGRESGSVQQDEMFI
jgi:methyl-accepting chemotaxis protein